MTMRIVLKALKINIFALVAIPLLLLAIVFKLIGRTVAKIPLFIGLIIAFAAIMSLISSYGTTMADIGAALSEAFFLLLVVIMGLMFLVAIFAVFGVLIRVVLYLIAYGFEALYNLCYMGYFSLYISCASDYQVLSLNGKKTLNGFICPFYSILRGLSWFITTVVSLTLPIAGACCIGLVAFTLFDLNRNTKMAFGMNLIRFIKKFSSSSVAGGILIYLSLMAIAIVAIMAIAMEAYEWSQELKMTGETIAEDISDLQQTQLHMASGEPDEIGNYQEYLNTLEDHLNQLDTLGQKVQDILDKKESPQLRSGWSSYMRNLEYLAEQCSEKNGITVKKLKRIIPQIKQLDKQRENVRKLTDKLAEELRNPAGSSIFFAGCDTPEKLEKRYKSLCKTYHPDTGDGDTETFQKMKDEYEFIKSAYGEGSQISS